MAANSAKVRDRRNLKYILFGHFGNCFSNVDGRIVRGKRFFGGRERGERDERLNIRFAFADFEFYEGV